jgi:hypothetical protein
LGIEVGELYYCPMIAIFIAGSKIENIQILDLSLSEHKGMLQERNVKAEMNFIGKRKGENICWFQK